MPLEALVKPRSVAIVGATDRPGPGRSIVELLGAIGFTGAIYPVNPKYPTVLNHACYPTLTDLPEAPDVVVFSIRNPLIPGADAPRRETRRARRRDLRQRLRRARRGRRQAAGGDRRPVPRGGDGGVRAQLHGHPQSAGARHHLQADRDEHRRACRQCRSGLAERLGLHRACSSDLRRFGISLSVSAGNEAVTRTVDYLEYLIDDPETKVIATFTETVREPERYVAALDRAAAAGKPVVVLKVGRTERTQRAITSHTGGLAGESRVFSEVLRAHRAIEVTDLDEMTEVLAVCQGRRWPHGRAISVITGSGGLAEMILDNATAVGLELPPLSSEERSEAERVIGRITGDGNPFDAWGNGNYAVNTPHALSVVDKSERIDAIVYCADTSNEGHLGHPGRILENVKMLAEAAEKSSKPYYLMSSRPGVMNSQQVEDSA